jgi:hypothetical protein
VVVDFRDHHRFKTESVQLLKTELNFVVEVYVEFYCCLYSMDEMLTVSPLFRQMDNYL